MVQTIAAPRPMQVQFPRNGRVCWIGLRTAPGGPVSAADSVQATVAEGLAGDRFAGKPGAARQVTLFQEEHLAIIGSLLGTGPVSPERTRRNIVVSGINLIALKGARIAVGGAELRITGACPPCRRMEENLGPGGFNAMRGHGGVTACVVRDGLIAAGDEVRFLEFEETE